MASYVAAYRVGMLISTAGALLLVSQIERLGIPRNTAWTTGYIIMAGLVVVGIITTLIATEPSKSEAVEAEHAKEAPFARVFETAWGAFSEFLARDMAIAVLVFVVLFKFTDALAGAMTPSFVIKTGFSRDEYAAIIKGVGFAATLLGGFAGGFMARAYPLPTCLWIGGIIQSLANLAFSWQAVIGYDIWMLTVAITIENFTSAVGTVFFVAYLSALCRNPLHTATQYALLTALAAVGRTYLSAGAGYIADATGWVWFFAICATAGLPSLVLLAWLQRWGHFATLEQPAEKK
jgi:PAT family beta-lactamase induction signal transducer AmpG